MKLIHKRGNRYMVRQIDKRRHNENIADMARRKREAALAVKLK